MAFIITKATLFVCILIQEIMCAYNVPSAPNPSGPSNESTMQPSFFPTGYPYGPGRTSFNLEGSYLLSERDGVEQQTNASGDNATRSVPRRFTDAYIRGHATYVPENDEQNTTDPVYAMPPLNYPTQQYFSTYQPGMPTSGYMTMPPQIPNPSGYYQPLAMGAMPYQPMQVYPAMMPLNGSNMNSAPVHFYQQPARRPVPSSGNGQRSSSNNPIQQVIDLVRDPLITHALRQSVRDYLQETSNSVRSNESRVGCNCAGQNSAADNTAGQNGADDNTAGQNSAADNTAGQNGADDNTAGQNSAADNTAGQNGADDNTAGQNGAAGNTAGQNGADDNTAGQNGAAGNTAGQNGADDNNARQNRVRQNRARQTSVKQTSGDSSSAGQTNAERTGARQNRARQTSVKQTSADSSSAGQTNAERTGASQTSGDSSSAGQTNAERTGASQTSGDSNSAGQSGVESKQTVSRLNPSLSNSFIDNYTSIVHTNNNSTDLLSNIFNNFIILNEDLIEFITNRKSSIGGMPKTMNLLKYMMHEFSEEDTPPEEVISLGAITVFFGSFGINVGDYYEPWFYMSDKFLRLVRSEFGKIDEGRPLFLRLIPDNDFSEDSQSCPSSTVGIDSTSAHSSVQFIQGENILPKESDQTYESRDKSLEISSTGVPTSIRISDLINRSAVIELFDYFEKLESRSDPRLLRGIVCKQDRFKLGNVTATNIFIDNKFLIAQHRSSIRRREQQNKLVIGNAELVIDKNMKFNGENFKLTMFVCSEIIDNVSTLKLYTLNSNGRWECISQKSKLRKSADEINQLLENTANIFSLCYSLTESS